MDNYSHATGNLTKADAAKAIKALTEDDLINGDVPHSDADRLKSMDSARSDRDLTHPGVPSPARPPILIPNPTLTRQLAALKTAALALIDAHVGDAPKVRVTISGHIDSQSAG